MFIGCLLCIQVVDGDCVTDGIAILDVHDGVFDMSVNLDVGYVENAVKE